MYLAALDADGTVKYCLSGTMDGFDTATFYEKAESYTNVKKIQIAGHYNSGHETFYVNAAVLTQDGKVISYVDGAVNERELPEVCDVMMESDSLTVYTLSSDGTVRKAGYNQVIEKDVVKFSNNEMVKRSGALAGGGDSFKTAVYDEWLIK